MSGFITLHRQIVDWEWYDDHNTFRVFIHCLFKANYKAKIWRGHNINRGEFISSVEKIGIELGLSRQQVRTAIKKLASTKEITTVGRAQHTVFIVKKYDFYQSNEVAATNRTTSELTNEQPTSNQRVTTTNNNNNNNKENNREKSGRFTPPSQQAVTNYFFANKSPNAATEAEKFVDFYTSKNWQVGINQMNDWSAAARKWIRTTNESHKQSNQHGKPSVVARAHAAAAEREQARRIKEREINGSIVAATSGGIWPPTEQSVRGNDAGELGTIIDGDFTQST